MIREIHALYPNKFDVLVVGGGIFGACTAWDAAQRGLSVALIEKGDFGHATSANSLKIIHGGLRYLQSGNLGLARTMIRERRAFMQIAPHLVHPLPCILPTYPKLDRSKPVLGAALMINDLLGFDRNHDQSDSGKHLPPGQILSKEEYSRRVPGMADKNLTGGAVWHDAQVYNTERLTLSFILSAAQHGAIVANYVEATDFILEDRRVVGINAIDVLADSVLEIRAGIVVNTAGPWSDELLNTIDGNHHQVHFRPSLALNLVTRQIIPDYAVGFSSNAITSDQKGKGQVKAQTLFIAPWREYSLVGTKHFSFEQSIDNYQPPEKLILDFVAEINASIPGASLNQEDVYFIHCGFLPEESSNGSQDVKLVRENQIHDHSKVEIEGLITVTGVKYTLARHAAEKATDLMFIKLDRIPPPCQTRNTPLHGGKIDRLEAYISGEAEGRHYTLHPDTLRRLIYNYGTTYHQVLKCLDDSSEWAEPLCGNSGVIGAEVVHGVRNEMARKLSDVVLRRTELGSAGRPSEASIHACANIMAAELGWDHSKIGQEIDELDSYYSARTLA